MRAISANSPPLRWSTRDHSAPGSSVKTSSRRARVFAGHSGWGPGQLEAEMEREDWIVAPLRREDVFTEEPGALWSRVLQRKGGEFALMARMPYDPSVN
jgi:putative transcriptional regulator